MLAPSEVALLFANGPPHGVWSDNLLVLAHPHRDARPATSWPSSFPTSSATRSPSCEVLSCKVVAAGQGRRRSRPSSAPAAARSR